MKPLETTYNPEGEDEIYANWEQSGAFSPDSRINADQHQRGSARIKNQRKSAHGKVFSMVLPPPNVTGVLHMGHAFETTIQDILVRYHRMKGDETLWIPGTDHAAIATQEKVERDLYKKEGKTRHDLGREEFLRRVEAFAKQSHDTIVTQIRKMGASLDWSREAFTLDEPRSLAVRTAFKTMYDMGLIYRGERMVNWDPKLQTTVSDDEIEWREEKTPLYYLKYGPFEIATARPETKFGDKYVVMNPKDKRYAQYKHGETLEVEWINGRVTATIIKDNAVDPKFGTGVMTITPWHDATDYDIAQRHNLAKEQIIDLRGKLLPIAGEFAGVHIKKARPLILEKLATKGLLVKTDEAYVHRVAVNSRGEGMIEPQILKQWFIDVNKQFTLLHSKIKGIRSGSEVTLKEIMTRVVKSRQIEIIPERFKKIYFHWINNLRDWCISRQIWYGHRIPVWYHEPKCIPRPGREKDIVHCKEIIISNTEPRCEFCDADFTQDPDTLDTWFSSGLWTFSTLGWPQGKTWDLKIYDGEKIFERLANGTKRFETRAGKPEGADKDWREFRVGDVINFTLVEEGTERVLSKKIITKQVVAIHHFSSIDELLEKIDVNEVHPYRPEEYRLWWESRPVFKERIQKYGIWAFELKDWDLPVYHPTSVIAPGYEILFFWVARMILMSGALLGDIPFKTVFLHGIVRDKQGRKFSKSLGNGIDPLELIKKYGADALRMALVAGAAPGADVKFDEERVRGYRNFSTKLWNIGRFLLLQEQERGFTQTEPLDFARGKRGSTQIRKYLTTSDKAYLKEFETLKKKVTNAIESFRFHDAAYDAYHYVWHRFADTIIEETKPRLAGDDANDRAAALAMLTTIFTDSLKLLHPFMPFVTETLYQKFTHDNTSLITAPW